MNTLTKEQIQLWARTPILTREVWASGEVHETLDLPPEHEYFGADFILERVSPHQARLVEITKPF